MQGADLAGPKGAQIKQENALAYAQKVQDEYQYFKGLLYQQREYNVMRDRAEEAFQLSRQYAEQDYHTQRMRSEEEYQIARGRAIADFNRSMSRAQADYDLQRKRAEEDHAHQVQLMIEQQAMAYSNMYQRVGVQRTESTAWMTTNLEDQTRRITEQTENLQQARKMGLTTQAIQQAGFGKTENAQQLARFIGEAQNDPSVVKELNKAVRQNVKAAGGLFTDESNKDWKEFQRQYRLGMSRGEQDFNRSMRRSRNDFNRQLDQQQDDYQRMMDNQQEDYEKMMGRQVKAYNLQMEQAAEDLARSAKTIDGNFENILTKATRRLSGHAAKQAQAVLTEFSTSKEDIRGVSAETMMMISDIFGFNWKPPASAKPPKPGQPGFIGPTYDPNGRPTQSNNTITRAAGGMIPGWTPGRDTVTVEASGGEAIMRPEWARAVGKETIDQMNHQAAYGGFAKGGVVNPSARVTMDGEPLTKITAAQLLLAEKLSGTNITVMQGSFQPYTSYSKSSHMGAGVMDTSPGNFDQQKWLRRVGFAAWGRNFPGAAYAGSGAHVHSVSRLDPGARGHAQLSSFARGEDGLGGPDYGPDPELMPNLMEELSQFSNLQISQGSAGGGVTQRSLAPLSSIIKSEYPEIENKVAKWVGIHLPRGTISNVINKLATRKYNKLKSELPVDVAPGSTGTGIGPLPPSAGSGTSSSNQRLGKDDGREQGLGQVLASAAGSCGPVSRAGTTPRTTRLLGVRHPAGTDRLTPMPRGYVDRTHRVRGHTQGYGGDPRVQIDWGLNYIQDRYGNPAKALNFHDANNWYADGSDLHGRAADRGGRAGVGGRDPAGPPWRGLHGRGDGRTPRTAVGSAWGPPR